MKKNYLNRLKDQSYFQVKVLNGKKVNKLKNRSLMINELKLLFILNFNLYLKIHIISC